MRKRRKIRLTREKSGLRLTIFLRTKAYCCDTDDKHFLEQLQELFNDKRWKIFEVENCAGYQCALGWLVTFEVQEKVGIFGLLSHIDIILKNNKIDIIDTI